MRTVGRAFISMDSSCRVWEIGKAAPWHTVCFRSIISLAVGKYLANFAKTPYIFIVWYKKNIVSAWFVHGTMNVLGAISLLLL
jgi:hypothetical protein